MILIFSDFSRNLTTLAGHIKKSTKSDNTSDVLFFRLFTEYQPLSAKSRLFVLLFAPLKVAKKRMPLKSVTSRLEPVLIHRLPKLQLDKQKED